MRDDTLIHLYNYTSWNGPVKIFRDALHTLDTDILQAWRQFYPTFCTDYHKTNNWFYLMWCSHGNATQRQETWCSHLDHHIHRLIAAVENDSLSRGERKDGRRLLEHLIQYVDAEHVVSLKLQPYLTMDALLYKLHSKFEPAHLPAFFGHHWPTIHTQQHLLERVYRQMSFARFLGQYIKPRSTAVHMLVRRGWWGNECIWPSPEMLHDMIEYLYYEKGISPLQFDQNGRLADECAVTYKLKYYLARQQETRRLLLLVLKRKEASMDPVIGRIGMFLGGDIDFTTGAPPFDKSVHKEHWRHCTPIAARHAAKRYKQD